MPPKRPLPKKAAKPNAAAKAATRSSVKTKPAAKPAPKTTARTSRGPAAAAAAKRVSAAAAPTAAANRRTATATASTKRTSAASKATTSRPSRHRASAGRRSATATRSSPSSSTRGPTSRSRSTLKGKQGRQTVRDGQSEEAAVHVSSSSVTSEDDSSDSSEDVLLFGSDPELSIRTPSTSRPPDRSSMATDISFYTPLTARTTATPAEGPTAPTEAVSHPEHASVPRIGASRDQSPEVLTADSEGKRSSQRWQQQLLTGHTASVTQRLREEDALEEEETAQEARLLRGSTTRLDADVGEDGVPVAEGAAADGADLNRGRGRDAEEEEAVKRLFRQPARSISCDRDASFLIFVDEASNTTTAVMEDGQADEAAQLQRHGPRTRAARSSKESDSSGFSTEEEEAFSPPGSPTKDTPPPPPLARPPARVPQSKPSKEGGLAHLSDGTNSGDLLRTASTVDLALLHGPTLLSTLSRQTLSSASSSSPVLPHAHSDGVPQRRMESGSPSPDPRCSRQSITAAAAAAAMRAGPSTQAIPQSQLRPLPLPMPVSNNSNRSEASSRAGSLSSVPTPLPPNAGVPAPPGSAHPTTTGHLRMGGGGGSCSRPRSPSSASSTAVSFNWMKRVNAAMSVSPSGGTHNHPANSNTTSRGGGFPAYPLQASASASGRPVVVDVDGDSEGSLSMSPQRLRQREPPVWRSPRPTQYPTSLNVSPPSVEARTTPPLVVVVPPTMESGGVNQKAAAEDLLKATQRATPPMAVIPPASASPAVAAAAHHADGAEEKRSQRPRSPSTNSVSSTTTVPTQTFTQASAEAASSTSTTAVLADTNSGGAPITTTPQHQRTVVAADPSQVSLAAGRLSTQLINKAAATRPTASPATMWICLDDDDDEEEEEEEHEAQEGDTPRSSGIVGAGVEKQVKKEKEESLTAAPPAVHALQRTAQQEAAEGPVVVRDHHLKPSHGYASGQLPEDHASISADEMMMMEMTPQLSGSLPGATPSQQQSPLPRRKPAERSHPISEILSPTFRPRRRPLLSPLLAAAVHHHDDGVEGEGDPRRHFIRLDDDENDDNGSDDRSGGADDTRREMDDDGEDAPPRKRPRLSESPAPADSARPAFTTPQKPQHQQTAEAQRASHPSPGPVVSKLAAHRPQQLSIDAPLIIHDDDDEEDDKKGSRAERRAAHGANQNTGAVSMTPEEKSPLKPNVKDLFFPKRLDPEVRPSSPLYQSIHAYQQHYQQQHGSSNSAAQAMDFPSFSTTDATLVSSTSGKEHTATRALAGTPERPAADALPRSDEKQRLSTASTIPSGTSPGHKRSRAEAADRPAKAAAVPTAVLAPALPDWGRPADTLLRDFFPAKFTRKSFMEAAQKVMSPMHFLEPRDFWDAFQSAEFVGEGSFGLVWRCRTADGDLVAVKSCPVILRTKANIEDSFSIIREIATMRFLNEMQVPYVLPLHSAFYVKAREALPPLAQEALEWRQKLRKAAEAAALEVEVTLLAKGKHAAHRRASSDGGAKQGKKKASVAAAAAPLTFDQQVALQLERLAASEGPAERATRARLQRVRLPRFLSITEEDLSQSDATAFLVMELCDGDVEGIARSDGVSKGVLYCVSSALAAMHELGLLHLDLKPSNVLFAYEHGPSQQQLTPSSSSGVVAASVTGPPPAVNAGAVKFYLSDFGNCRLVGPGPLAEVEEAYGTFEYMDHRALKDAVCGRPTDAFSLGATLYELLFGKRLYPKCQNPKCTAEEDHTRACFVEAANRNVVLPPPGNAGAAAKAAAPPSRAVRGSAVAAPPAVALTPLQHITLALLRKKWTERMTAAECRRYLIDAFHITQAEEEEHEEDRGNGVCE